MYLVLPSNMYSNIAVSLLKVITNMLNLEIREVITSIDNSPKIKERIISVSGSVCTAEEIAVAIQELTIAQTYLSNLKAAGV